MTQNNARTKTTDAANPASTVEDAALAPAARSLAARMIDTVEVQLEAFVGDTRMTVAELGGLGAGSVVALDSPLNQAVELRLNGAIVARGELVAVDDRFGVRLTEIAE